MDYSTSSPVLQNRVQQYKYVQVQGFRTRYSSHDIHTPVYQVEVLVPGTVVLNFGRTMYYCMNYVHTIKGTRVQNVLTP